MPNSETALSADQEQTRSSAEAATFRYQQVIKAPTTKFNKLLISMLYVIFLIYYILLYELQSATSMMHTFYAFIKPQPDKHTHNADSDFIPHYTLLLPVAVALMF